MNKAEWDAMEAEDRDGFMAESVMGWRDLEGYWFRDGDEGTEPTGYYVYDGETLDRLGEMQWHPTTDRNACALVLERICKDERIWCCFCSLMLMLGAGSSHNMVDGHMRNFQTDAIEKIIAMLLLSSPDTICYAAVKAVEG